MAALARHRLFLDHPLLILVAAVAVEIVAPQPRLEGQAVLAAAVPVVDQILRQARELQARLTQAAEVVVEVLQEAPLLFLLAMAQQAAPALSFSNTPYPYSLS